MTDPSRAQPNVIEPKSTKSKFKSVSKIILFYTCANRPSLEKVNKAEVRALFKFEFLKEKFFSRSFFLLPAQF